MFGRHLFEVGSAILRHLKLENSGSINGCTQVKKPNARRHALGLATRATKATIQDKMGGDRLRARKRQRAAYQRSRETFGASPRERV